jgi:predicted O-methyltransferase YrrM
MHHPARWPALLAVVLAAGLLLVFDRVVRQGVVQGAQRQAAQAAQSQANWRCATLPKGPLRTACLGNAR